MSLGPKRDILSSRQSSPNMINKPVHKYMYHFDPLGPEPSEKKHSFRLRASQSLFPTYHNIHGDSRFNDNDHKNLRASLTDVAACYGRTTSTNKKHSLSLVGILLIHLGGVRNGDFEMVPFPREPGAAMRRCPDSCQTSL
ncbi:hypothetical protein ElyMa_006081300 [Elysia marginata]|uniref:Uncharacterized protein n=1 Tax=Elysia marginata TaxID=1093978 RepID=A0AAV4GP90_9GAST|nr:hypothetical protein ElyMa_006081300 [Elysia marginata]